MARNVYQAPVFQQLISLGIWAACLLFLIVLQQMIGIEGSDRFSRGLQNAAHGPWFAVVTWLIWRCCDKLPMVWRMGLSRLLITALAAAVVASLSEILQLFTSRGASLSDLLFDLCGAAATLFLLQSHQHRMLKQKRRFTAFALLMLLVTQYPLFEAAFLITHQRALAPKLVDFDSRLGFLWLKSSSAVEVVAAPKQWREYRGQKTLKVVLAEERWPGISLDEPLADWSEFGGLEVDVFNPSEDLLKFNLSIRPESLEGSGTDNFYRAFILKSGANRIVIDLGELLLRRDKVRYVVLYSTREYSGRQLYIGGIWLR